MPAPLPPPVSNTSQVIVPSCDLQTECDRDLRARTLTSLLAALPSATSPLPFDNQDSTMVCSLPHHSRFVCKVSINLVAVNTDRLAEVRPHRCPGGLAQAAQSGRAVTRQRA